MKTLSFMSGAFSLLAFAALAQPGEEQSTSQGQYLARAANCVACHSVPGGEAFAGGLKMATPVGDIFVTNITPDDETGIGTYTLEDFDNAMRRGLAQDGHRLYPAMPYPSYAKITDEDIEALYDYFMDEVPAVWQENKENEIPWILSFRWPIAIWNILFLEDDTYAADSYKSDAWNRGAYLVQGLGHCGACHTPRGIAWNEVAFDESDPAYLSGAFLDNWYASDLTQSNRAGLGRWSKEDVEIFMKTGRNNHSTAFGTMDEVIINSTQYLSHDDLDGMAIYITSLPGAHDGEYVYNDYAVAVMRGPERKGAQGANLYMQNCESCHVDTGRGYPPYLPPLAGNPPVMDSDPASLINIVLNGSSRLIVDGTPDAYRMPGYRKSLNDQEIADIVSFMRSEWGNKASPVSAAQVAGLRALTEQADDRMPTLRMK
ncbi:MAG: cytochrome c [Rhodospirillaceae bacterium]|nr:cytochrome c [Rhodospirillaceae bacterium]